MPDRSDHYTTAERACWVWAAAVIGLGWVGVTASLLACLVGLLMGHGYSSFVWLGTAVGCGVGVLGANMVYRLALVVIDNARDVRAVRTTAEKNSPR
jgi:hypothetical protein